jgi:hypothetical protein
MTRYILSMSFGIPWWLTTHYLVVDNNLAMSVLWHTLAMSALSLLLSVLMLRCCLLRVSFS